MAVERRDRRHRRTRGASAFRARSAQLAVENVSLVRTCVHGVTPPSRNHECGKRVLVIRRLSP